VPVLALQSALGLVGLYLLYRIGRRLLGVGPARVGLVLAALYPVLVFFEAEPLEISWVLLAVHASVLLLLEGIDARGLGRTIRLAGSGLALGLGVLGKPNLLALVPVAALWAAHGGVRKRGAVILTALALLPPTAATVRNAVVAGDLVVVSANGGINFWIGNNPGATGGFRVPAEMRFDLYRGSKAAAERAVGHPLQASEVSSYWFSRGLDFWRRSPGDALLLLGRKLLLFVNRAEIPNYHSFAFFQTFSPALRLPLPTFGWIGPLALIGMIVAWRRRVESRPLAVWVGVYAATIVALFVTARYRLPVVGFLLLYAGFALHSAWEWARPAHGRPFALSGGVAAAAAGLAALLVVSHLPLCPIGFADDWNLLGTLAAQDGRLETAVANFRRSIALDPAQPNPHYNLGHALGMLGRPEEGIDPLRRALALTPGDPDAHRVLGYLLADSGDRTGAITALVAALEAGPQPPEVHFHLGRLLLPDPSRAEEAETELRRYLDLSPAGRFADRARQGLTVLGSDPDERGRASEPGSRGSEDAPR
jgi:tetratricopeptide (TPR) repeat protein